MPCWDPVRWPVQGAGVPSEARAALLEHAPDDAAALHLDAEAYHAWIVDALEDATDAGPRRAALSDGVLAQRSLPVHVAALLGVSAARRERASTVELREALTAWSEAEIAITVEVAQARFDDPSSARNRLATLGKAAGTLGHELRNPLGVIQSSVYLLGRRNSEDERAKRHIDKIGRHAGICHRIIEDLMHLARNAPPRLESLDIAEAYALAVEEAALPSVVMCRIEAPPGLRIQADAGLLQRALVNLLRNANTAMRGRGAVQLGVFETDEDLVLSVRDHGPGFPDDLLEQAFDPLSTTSGIGLGLALVDSVMRRHGGRASAENMPDGGARVTLLFPRHETAARASISTGRQN